MKVINERYNPVFLTSLSTNKHSVGFQKGNIKGCVDIIITGTISTKIEAVIENVDIDEIIDTITRLF